VITDAGLRFECENLQPAGWSGDTRGKGITDAPNRADYKSSPTGLSRNGMDGHEGPTWCEATQTLLARNMNSAMKPGIYIPGEFGVRLEDDMHITENGAELFTPQSPSLEDPFGSGYRLIRRRWDPVTDRWQWPPTTVSYASGHGRAPVES